MKTVFENGVVYCGDCLEIMNNLKVTDNKYDLCLTDPPYGIQYLSNRYQGINPHTEILNDDQLFINVELINSILKDCGALLFFFSQKILPTFPIKDILIWVKNNWSAGDLKSGFANQYEMIGYIPKDKFIFQNGRPSNVLYSDREPPVFHPTQKPVGLISKLVHHCSKEYDTVIDPFAGSGTTAIACIRSNRKFVMIEKEVKYYDIICKRIEHENSQTKLF